MKNEAKTKKQPSEELTELRHRVSELEQLQANYKQTADQLSELQAQVACLTKSVPAVTYRCKIEGQSFIPEFVSPNFKRQTGYEEEDCIGNPDWWPSHIHPEDQERVFQGLSELSRLGSYFHEYRFQRKNGTYRWTQDSLQLLTSEEGDPVEIVGSWLDITERKRERDQAKETHTIRGILNACVEPIFLLDKDGTVLALNEGLAQRFNRTVDELRGSRIFDLLPPDLAKERAERGEEVFRTGHSVHFHDQRDGRFFDNSIYPVCETPGEVTCIAVYSQDITAQRVADEALLKSQRSMAAAQKIAHFGNIERDHKTDKSWWSDEVYRILGTTPEECRPSFEKFLSYVHPADKQTLKDQQTKGISEGGTYSREYRIIRSNGEVRTVSGYLKVFVDEASSPVRMIGTILDITEGKEAERDLARYATRLAEVEETERHRLSRELHDRVGQALVALGIDLRLMRRELSADSLRKVSSRLEDAESLVVETIGHTRDVMTDLRPLDLDQFGLIPALKSYGERLSKRTDINLVFEGEEHERLDPFVEISLFRIAQEALTNVVKHAQAQQVLLRLETNNGSTCLSITDDGIGFDPGSIEEANDQASWGMLTMRERAQAIEGKVELKSVRGEGATVIVKIRS